MASSHGGFDSIVSINVDSLRETLQRTMVLGLPEDDANKPTFYWERQVTWDDYDSSNNPWDWTSAPLTDATPSPVAPVCAYEFTAPFGATSETVTEVGDFPFATVTVSLFEDEFQSVSGSSYLMFGPSELKYYFRYYRPAIGLGELTLYQIFLVADGEK